MAVIKYKTKDGEWKSIVNYTIAPLTPVQSTGTSTSDVMSQDAVTKQLALKADNTVVGDLSDKVDNINNMLDGSASGEGSTIIITNNNLNDYISSSTTITNINNQLKNEVGLVDGEYTPSQDNEIISGASSITEAIDNIANAVKNIDIIQVVSVLPSSDINENVIYLVPTADSGDTNIYIEYIYANGAWEKLGEFKANVDFSDYYNKSEIDNKLNPITNNINTISGTVENINEQMSATTGSFIVTNQNIENVLASSSTITDIKGDIDDINGYTVNSKAISGSPILNGADIKLDGYTVSDLTNEELQLSTADTVNVAFGKIAKAMNDNEHVISEAMNTFNSSCGFNENGKPNFTEDSLSAYTNILDAVDYLGGYVNYMTGHNEVTTLQGVPNDKRICLAKLSSNDAFTVSSSNLKDGRELHIIVYNNSSNPITVSMPTTATYVNLSGELLTIEANKYAEINVVAIGTYKYVRFAN